MDQAKLRQWFVSDGYLWDWIVAAVVIIINLVVPLEAIHPRDRYYVNDDPTLAYPYHENTISSAVLYLLVFLFPGVVYVASAALQKSWADG